MTLTISCITQKWATNQDWKRSFLKYCSTSMCQQLYPNFQKRCKHNSKQPIWDEKGWIWEVCNPILCQCPIQLLATIDSHTMLPSRNVRTKFGLEEKPYKINLSCNWFEIDNWLSHFVAKQKCEDQIWTRRKILQDIFVLQLTWNWCKISRPSLKREKKKQ